MRKALVVLTAITLAGTVRAYGQNTNAQGNQPVFQPGTLVLARSVYVGTPDLLVPGVTVLPPGCIAGNVQVPLIGVGTVSVAVTCSTPSNDATYPDVFNNSAADGHFGITSPIFLDSIGTDGTFQGTFPVPTDQIVTSFSSKSELAVHRSPDGKSLTFVAYRGGPGFPTSDRARFQAQLFEGETQ